jgi:hypothetical protein
VFVLYAIVTGLIVGRIAGGSLAGLAALRIRWGPLILAGLVVQLVLFSPILETKIGDLGPWVYVLSTGAVLTAVLRNWRIAGLPIVALGALSNAVAILANGGYMPASAAALASLGGTAPTVYSNSAVVTHPALEPLTDIFALPRALPFANVFSVGDILIALGVVVVLVFAMRARASRPPELPAVDPPSDRQPTAEVA